MVIDALISELFEEPGTMILFAYGAHVSRTFLIAVFHIRELLYTKFCRVISSVNFGRHMRRFDSLGLGKHNFF